MPEPVWIGYFILLFAILGSKIFMLLRQHRQIYTVTDKVISIGITSVFGAIVVMVPVFYLVYVGMIPRWRYGLTYLVLNFLVPFIWSYLAVYAWGTGKAFRDRYAVGICLFLTVPTLFLAVWLGVPVRFPYSLQVIDWVLFLTGVIIWLRSRLS